MDISRLGHLVDPLREMMSERAWHLDRYRKEKGAPIAGLHCDMLPAEFLLAAGALAVRVPPATAAGGCASLGVEELRIFDLTVRVDGCCVPPQEAGRKTFSFTVPGGYGEGHAAALGESMDALLREMGLPVIQDLERGRIAAAMETYNLMRRAVRGICSVRNAKPDLLSHGDLHDVMAAAACLPPDLVTETLALVLGRLNGGESRFAGPAMPALVHSCMSLDPGLIDRMEDLGCLVTEDDTCFGRRQFDLSFNVESSDPVREILEAYSFKPLCPGIRPVEERFELLYRLLKSYGIDLVIFVDNGKCPHRKREVEDLRKRMMRQGVDPLAVTPDDALDSLERYLRRAKG